MPVIKSAKKKLRVDKKRESANKKVRSLVEKAIKKAEKTPTLQRVQNAFSIIDKAVKNKVIHKNKASRIKSRLSKLIAGEKKGKSQIPKTTKTKKAENNKSSTFFLRGIEPTQKKKPPSPHSKLRGFKKVLDKK